MEEQLRRSAAAWRVVAAVVLVVWTAGAIALAYPFMANEQPLWAVGVALGGFLGALRVGVWSTWLSWRWEQMACWIGPRVMATPRLCPAPHPVAGHPPTLTNPPRW